MTIGISPFLIHFNNWFREIEVHVRIWLPFSQDALLIGNFRQPEEVINHIEIPV